MNRIDKIIKKIDEILSTHNDIIKIIAEEVRPEGTGYGIGNLHTHKTLMYLQAEIAFLLHNKYAAIDLEFMYPSEWRAICGIKNGRRSPQRNCKKI